MEVCRIFSIHSSRVPLHGFCTMGLGVQDERHERRKNNCIRRKGTATFEETLEAAELF
jgi:hypothetical protein